MGHSPRPRSAEWLAWPALPCFPAFEVYGLGAPAPEPHGISDWQTSLGLSLPVGPKNPLTRVVVDYGDPTLEGPFAQVVSELKRPGWPHDSALETVTICAKLAIYQAERDRRELALRPEEAAELLTDLGLGGGMGAADEPPWAEAVINIEGAERACRLLRRGEMWAVVADLETAAVGLFGADVGYEECRLRTMDDLEPYPGANVARLRSMDHDILSAEAVEEFQAELAWVAANVDASVAGWVLPWIERARAFLGPVVMTLREGRDLSLSEADEWERILDELESARRAEIGDGPVLRGTWSRRVYNAGIAFGLPFRNRAAMAAASAAEA